MPHAMDYATDNGYGFTLSLNYSLYDLLQLRIYYNQYKNAIGVEREEKILRGFILSLKRVNISPLHHSNSRI